MRIWHATALSVLLFLGLVTNLAAQEPSARFAVFANGGLGHVWRTTSISEDGVDIGVGLGLRAASKIDLEVEYNRVLGLSPEPVQCGNAGNVTGGISTSLPCTGSGRYGPDTYNVASFNVHYRLSDMRVRPYVLGGVGAAWSTGFSAAVRSTGSQVIITEDAWTDHGLAWNAGLGAEAFLTPKISVRTEGRYTNSILLSRENLSLFRVAAGLAFHW